MVEKEPTARVTRKKRGGYNNKSALDHFDVTAQLGDGSYDYSRTIVATDGALGAADESDALPSTAGQLTHRILKCVTALQSRLAKANRYEQQQLRRGVVNIFHVLAPAIPSARPSDPDAILGRRHVHTEASSSLPSGSEADARQRGKLHPKHIPYPMTTKAPWLLECASTSQDDDDAPALTSRTSRRRVIQPEPPKEPPHPNSKRILRRHQITHSHVRAALTARPSHAVHSIFDPKKFIQRCREDKIEHRRPARRLFDVFPSQVDAPASFLPSIWEKRQRAMGGAARVEGTTSCVAQEIRKRNLISLTEQCRVKEKQQSMAAAAHHPSLPAISTARCT